MSGQVIVPSLGNSWFDEEYGAFRRLCDGVLLIGHREAPETTQLTSLEPIQIEIR